MLKPTLLVTALLLLLAVPAPAQEKGELKGSPDNPLTPLDRAHTTASREGDFRVTWPSGCSQVKTRTPADDSEAATNPEAEYPVMVFCDRHGEKGDGCSVTVVFNARSDDGGPAGPAEVTVRMQRMLRTFGAEIKRQAPLQKDFGQGRLAEGLDVQAAQTGGAGQVWVRGLLVDGVIYILAAWDLGGHVWENPEYITFFNSFQPGVE